MDWHALLAVLLLARSALSGALKCPDGSIPYKYSTTFEGGSYTEFFEAVAGLSQGGKIEGIPGSSGIQLVQPDPNTLPAPCNTQAGRLSAANKDICGVVCCS